MKYINNICQQTYKNEQGSVRDVFFLNIKMIYHIVKLMYKDILIVDLLDIPNSISRSWVHLADQTTENHNISPNIIVVLGNQIDLLLKSRFI